MASHQYFFGGKHDIHEKLIEIFTTSTFYLEFIENEKNYITFCYFQLFGPILLLALIYGSFPAADARLAGVCIHTEFCMIA